MENGERPGWFSFEKLEVYHLAVEFRRLCKKIIADLPPESADDADQLKRSAKSMVRNLCEGAGEYRRAEKARFYRMSLRSAEESGGTIRILIDDYGEKPEYKDAIKILLTFIPKMIALCKRK
jgi:four helix bundle protein